MKHKGIVNKKKKNYTKFQKYILDCVVVIPK